MTNNEGKDRRQIVRFRDDDMGEEAPIEKVLEAEGITKDDLEKYDSYLMHYRAMRAVLKHRVSSPETINRFISIERMIGEHIKDEMEWKNDVLAAISTLSKNVSDMKPTVKKVSDIDTFLSVGNRIGWIILLMVMAAMVGLYTFGKQIFTGFR